MIVYQTDSDVESTVDNDQSHNDEDVYADEQNPIHDEFYRQ